MKLLSRIGSVAAVAAVAFGVAGCKTRKPEVNPYTGLMSARGNVPPAYLDSRSVSRPAAPVEQDVTEGSMIGGANDFVPPAGPVFEEEAAPMIPAPEELPEVKSEAAPAPEAVKPAAAQLPEIPNSGEVPMLGDTKSATAKTVAAAENIYVVRGGDTLSKIAAAHGVKTADILAANPKVTSADKICVGQKLVLPAGASASTSPAKAPAKAAAPAKQSSASAVAKESIPADGTYTVQAGDSLWVISKRFGVKSDDLRAWNNLTTDKVRVGQVLKLKGDAAAPKAVETNPAPKAVETVPAPKAEEPAPAPVIPVETAEPAIGEGPVEPVVEAPAATEAVTTQQMIPYCVMAGDTLEGIATTFYTTQELILQANPQIKSDADLKDGITLQVPMK